MNLLISNIINEPVKGFKPYKSGWYVVIRAEQEGSERFNICFQESLKGIVAFLYDRKTNKTTKHELGKVELKGFKPITKFSNLKEKPKVNNNVKDILSKGTISDANNYLKDKGLDTFLDKDIDYTWRVCKSKKYGTALVVPYTTFDYFPEFIGANLYLKDKKQFLKGSYSGSFSPHRLKEGLDLFILAEGFRECFLAFSVCPKANVLEVGGLSKFRPVIMQIRRLYPEAKIVVMGDIGSEEQLKELNKEFVNVKINYPPEGKDFSDWYSKARDTQALVEYMFGRDITKDNVNYKALGIEAGKMVLYSKFLNTMIKVSPDKVDEVIRTCVTLKGWEGWLPKEKKEIVSDIWSDCVSSGLYQTNKVFGIGLWSNKKGVLLYNTGENLYKVEKDRIIETNYVHYAENSFLPIKTQTEQPVMRDLGFEGILKDVDKVFQSLDWKFPHYGSLLLGFIAQAVYAGVLEFRPNMWIFSDEKSAGKSFLSNWIRTNMLPINKTKEGGASSLAGTRQVMANNSCLLHIDELAEEGTAFVGEALNTFELLRSSTGGYNPINLGTAEQNPIYQRLKFSSLFAVINGRELLREQDESRCVFISMVAGNKQKFKEKLLPKLNKLKSDERLKGFLYYVVSKYHQFEEFYPYFEDVLGVYPIGHRVRGLASILAGYSALYGDKKYGYKLYEQFKSSDAQQFNKYKNFDEKTDFFNTLCNTIVDSRFLGSYDESDLFISLAKSGHLKKYGVYTNENFKNIYFQLSKTQDFINKVMKTKYNLPQMRRILENSPSYLKRTRVMYGSEQVRAMVFSVC